MDSERSSSWPRRVLFLPLVLTVLAGVARFGDQLPTCLFYESTGWHCPGCGATRATGSLVAFQWGTALHQNAFWSLVVLMGIPFFMLNLLAATFPRISLLRLFQWRHSYLWGILAILVIFALVRNLPGFEWLNPDRVK